MFGVRRCLWKIRLKAASRGCTGHDVKFNLELTCKPKDSLSNVKKNRELRTIQDLSISAVNRVDVPVLWNVTVDASWHEPKILKKSCGVCVDNFASPWPLLCMKWDDVGRLCSVAVLPLCLFATDTNRESNSKQDGSLELASRYGCTQPSFEQDDDDSEEDPDMCGVEYSIAQSYLTPSTIAAVKIGD